MTTSAAGPVSLLGADPTTYVPHLLHREGRTIVPLRLYFNDRGIAKIALALAKGKKAHDKREATKDRDWKRDQSRLLRQRG